MAQVAPILGRPVGTDREHNPETECFGTFLVVSFAAGKVSTFLFRWLACGEASMRVHHGGNRGGCGKPRSPSHPGGGNTLLDFHRLGGGVRRRDTFENRLIYGRVGGNCLHERVGEIVSTRGGHGNGRGKPSHIQGGGI